MALVKCPECNKKVSDQAKACPNCGFPLEEYEFDTTKQKKSYKKIWIILLIVVSVGITTIGVLAAIGITKAIVMTVEEKEEFFKLSGENSADIYGLSNENNILGKPITDILTHYEEGKDYSIETNEQYTMYTFVSKYSYYGEKANLIIYTAVDSSKIEMFAYEFKTPTDGHDINLYKIRADLTDYYCVDPQYFYVNGNNQIQETDKDTFSNLLYQEDYKTIYHITWEKGDEVVTMLITNTHNEADETCYVTFTRKSF